MTENSSLEMRLQKPFAQSMLISTDWVDQGLSSNDIAVLLAVTVRSLEANRDMPDLGQQLASMLQKD
jgi:hypothetical protein